MSQKNTYRQPQRLATPFKLSHSPLMLPMSH